MIKGFEPVATLRIEGCGPCAPDVGFDLHLDEYDRNFHGRDINLYSDEDVRQLAEQRAELLEALILLLNEVDESAVANARDYGRPVAVAKSRVAIANATQQRNATGGEG